MSVYFTYAHYTIMRFAVVTSPPGGATAAAAAAAARHTKLMSGFALHGELHGKYMAGFPSASITTRHVLSSCHHQILSTCQGEREGEGGGGGGGGGGNGMSN